MDDLSAIASKSLGDSTSYAVYTDKADPTLLNPMPRALARESWGLDVSEMDGIDVWHCHEATFLLSNGVPVAGTLKIIYSAKSEYMIESKSMKLYLNSYDMMRIPGDSPAAAMKNYADMVAADLSAALGTPVAARFHHHPRVEVFPSALGSYYESLDDIVLRMPSFEITDFRAAQSHLESIETGRSFESNYQSGVLRSRCRHTKQKDTGSAFFDICGSRLVTAPSIFKHLVSLREVNEFHEFCAEKLCTDLWSHVKDSSQGRPHVCVALLYARRGSLDINPIRWMGNRWDKPSLDSTKIIEHEKDLWGVRYPEPFPISAAMGALTKLDVLCGTDSQ